MVANNALTRFEELLTEGEICKRFSVLLGLRELRRARQNGENRLRVWQEGDRALSSVRRCRLFIS